MKKKKPSFCVLFGQFHPKAKITDHEAELLIRLRKEGMSYRKLAIKFDMSISGVYYICTGIVRRR